MKKFLAAMLIVAFLTIPLTGWFSYRHGYRSGVEDMAEATIKNRNYITPLADRALTWEKNIAGISDKEYPPYGFMVPYGKDEDTSYAMPIIDRQRAKAPVIFTYFMLFTDNSYPVTFAKLGYKQFADQDWLSSVTDPRAPHFLPK